MSIGKTLTSLVLAGAIGFGGVQYGRYTSQDPEYVIKRDEAGVYLQARVTGEEQEIKMYGTQLVVGNNSEQVLGSYKTKLTDEITDIVTQQLNEKSTEKK